MLLLYRDIQNNFIEVELPTEGGIVGYEADNFIVLDAIGISGKHMRLSAVGNHLFVEDLQSLNGTYINQKLSSEKTQLSDGDVVQIGLLQLRFNFDSNSWTMTAETPASSVFLEAQYEKSDSQEFEDVQISTAVTVIASPEIKAAIKSGNISALTTLEATQPANIIPPTRFSLENLKELGKYNIIKKTVNTITPLLKS
jgi:predicted component of type VI protein secretion system